MGVVAKGFVYMDGWGGGGHTPLVRAVVAAVAGFIVEDERAEEWGEAEGGTAYFWSGMGKGVLVSHGGTGEKGGWLYSFMSPTSTGRVREVVQHEVEPSSSSSLKFGMGVLLLGILWVTRYRTLFLRVTHTYLSPGEASL